MAERKQREEPGNQARQQAGQTARAAESRNALKSEGATVSATVMPLASRFAGIFRKPWLIWAIVAFACPVIAAYIYMFHWSSRAGARWAARVSDVSQSFLEITGSSDGRVLYACGAQPLKSVDGGATWVLQSDGALSCRTAFVTPDGARFFIYPNDERMGLFTIFMSSDGATTWRKVDTNPLSGPSPDVGSIDSIFGTPDGSNIWVLQTLWDVQYDGYQAVIAESKDGGSTWKSGSGVFNFDLLSLAGLGDGSFLVAVGTRGRIIYSNDSGMNWQQRNGGTQEQLNAVFAAANSKLICAVGFNGAVVVSTDEGDTWTKRPVGTAVNLSGVFGTSDGRHLWVVGDSSTILE